jgi:hypothetical protein
MKQKSPGKSERRFISGREKEYHYVRSFPGFALSSFWQGQCDSANVITIRNSGLR